jgi:hypothetical protein
MHIVRLLVALLLLLLVVVIAGVAYVMLSFPKVSPAPEMAIEATPERLERGRYLAEHVMGCKACHSQPRVDRYSHPPVADTAYGGGYRWGPEEGLPGVVVSANLTPHALGDWSDGEIQRAITSGVSRDGSALFSLMPYPFYAKVDAEDISAVVVYLRTLAPVDSSPPRQQLDPFMKLIVRTMPADPSPRRLPDGTDTVALGEYLATAALCEDCHTDFAGGRFVGTPFAGGRAFPYPGLGLFRSANITPHAETGIGDWSREDFIARFKAQPPEAYDDWEVVPGEENTIMPWWAYAGMTESDLGAIYDYLHSLPATANEVVRFEPLPEGG